MHMWIVIAAFAFAAVTPYLGAPSRSDVAQIMDEQGETDVAAEESDGDERQV